MMNGHRLILVSLGLNLALGVALVSVVTPRGTTSPPFSAPVLLPSSEPTMPRSSFHWREIESPDFATYVANLRGIRCPEETVRDIIVAEVNEFSFDTPARLALLRHLFGEDFVAPVVGDESPNPTGFEFLPYPKRLVLAQLLAGFAGVRRVLPMEGDDAELPVDFTEARAQHAMQQQMLEAWLTSAELAEYRLRFDPLANTLRQQLAGFEPSDGEFRRVFAALQAHEERFAFLAADDEVGWQNKCAAREQVEREIETSLGPERAEQYRRATDVRFRNLTGLAKQFGLPEDRAVTAFETGVLIHDEWRRLQADATLEPGDKIVAEQTLQQLLAVNLRQQLGAAAYQHCLDTGLERWFGDRVR